MARWTSIDYFLFVWYCLFAFTALVFEPLFYFGCNWNAHTCKYASTFELVNIARTTFLIYCKWDPMFYVIPLWLQVLSCIEVFIFGPLYAVVAYGLYKDASWLSSVSLPFCGALIYSTIVYFAMEVIENLPGTNMALVFLINIPWTFVPIILIYKLVRQKKDKKH